MVETRSQKRARDAASIMLDEPSWSAAENDGGRDRKKSKVVSESKSSEVEKTCGICLSNVREQGRLDCCKHVFCFGCIVEWGKVESNCPMCKQRITIITKPGRIVFVEEKKQVYEPSHEELERLAAPQTSILCHDCEEAIYEDNMHLCCLCQISAIHPACIERYPCGRRLAWAWRCQFCSIEEHYLRLSNTLMTVQVAAASPSVSYTSVRQGRTGGQAGTGDQVAAGGQLGTWDQGRLADEDAGPRRPGRSSLPVSREGQQAGPHWRERRSPAVSRDGQEVVPHWPGRSNLPMWMSGIIVLPSWR